VKRRVFYCDQETTAKVSRFSEAWLNQGDRVDRHVVRKGEIRSRPYMQKSDQRQGVLGLLFKNHCLISAL